MLLCVAVKPVPYMKRGSRQMRGGLEGWRLRVKDPKSNRQVERTFYGTYEEAVVEIARFSEEREGAIAVALPEAHSATVAEWAVAWMKRYRWKIPPTANQPGQRRPYPTVAKHVSVLSAYVVPALGANTRLRTLTHDGLLAAVADLMLADGSGPVAPSTKATVVGTLKVMFRDAVRAGVMTSNPAADLPTAWGPTSRVTMIPSIVEAERLAEAMDARPHSTLGDMVRVISFVGLRMEELVGLRISDLDLEKRTLWIRRTVTESGGRRTVQDGGKTASAFRSVVILDQAVEPLKRLVAHSEAVGSDLLACGPRGGYLAYCTWRGNLKIARERAGLTTRLTSCATCVLLC